MMHASRIAMILVFTSAFASGISPVAPHTLNIEKSLKGALNQIKTLREEVARATPNNSPQEDRIAKTAQAASSNIANALKEQNQLKYLSNSYLEIRKNPDFSALNANLSQLMIDYHNLTLRISERSFTRDKHTVLKDLSSIQSTLSHGVQHADALNAAVSKENS